MVIVDKIISMHGCDGNSSKGIKSRSIFQGDCFFFGQRYSNTKGTIFSDLWILKPKM